jgi:Tol biopolymer transport system component
MITHTAPFRTRIVASVVLLAGAMVVGLAGCGGGASPSTLSQPGSGISAATRPATRFLVSFAGFDASSRAPHRLEVVDRHGRVLRVLSTASFGTSGLWSPNNGMIAWQDPSGLYVENAADGSQRRRLVASSACENCQTLSFIWSPDSRSLIVGSAPPKGNELLLVPIDGGAANVLASSATPGVFYMPVRWTPDGRSLVYDESGTTLAFPGTFMRVLTPATGRTRTLWSTPNAQDGAQWVLISPDDRKRAYITELEQYHEQLRIVDAGKSRIVAGVNPTNFAAWSPNSRLLAVVESGWHVVTVTADGRQVRKIGPGEQVSWGHNGELFIQRADYNQVWVSENGGPETFLFHVPKGDFVDSMDAN